MGGNLVNTVDPSGHCSECGDETCWGVYEEIIQLCPKCSEEGRYWVGGFKKLHEENINYLEDYLNRLKTGWRPYPILRKWHTYGRFDVILPYMYKEMITKAQSSQVAKIKSWLRNFG